MPRPPVFTRVAELIERRIEAGDYLLNDIPGERRIAEDAGVSHMTARKAVSMLLERGVLIRRPNGSLDVSPDRAAGTASSAVALLYPSAASPHLLRLRYVVAAAAEASGLTLRPVQFVHWDDPIVRDALEFDGGAIVIPSTEPIGTQTLSRLKAGQTALLDADLSDESIASIRLFPDDHIRLVFDRLVRAGHWHIGCISTEDHTPEILRRLSLWHDFADEHGLDVELFDEPVHDFADPMPIACEIVRRRVAGGQTLPSAFIGMTFPAAVGASRALWESGVVVGKDVSVAAVNIEPPARYMTPAVTGLDMPDLRPALQRCFDWFASGDAWEGPFLLEPETPNLLEGESVVSLD
ncbi:MAG: substrate-binding domain-containing protein [Planctomycetota bacterium]